MFGWRFWWVRSIRTVGRSSPRCPSPSSVLDPSRRRAASCDALNVSGLPDDDHGPLGPAQRRTALRGGGCLRSSSPAPVISSPGRELRSQRGRVQPARRYYNYLPTLGCKTMPGPARLGGPAGLPARSPRCGLPAPPRSLHPPPCCSPCCSWRRRVQGRLLRPAARADVQQRPARRHTGAARVARPASPSSGRSPLPALLQLLHPDAARGAQT